MKDEDKRLFVQSNVELNKRMDNFAGVLMSIWIQVKSDFNQNLIKTQINSF